MRATASELLYEAADELRNQLEQLLARSSLTHFDPVMQHSVWFGPTGEWADLDTEGRQIQARLLEDYRHFAATLRTLLRGLTSEALREFEDADTNITEVIDQSKLTFLKTLDDAREHVRLGLGKQEELLG